MVKAELILFHGGGWVGGSPHDLRDLSDLLDGHGIRTILPGYRVLERDDTGLHEAMDDAIAAVRHHKANREHPDVPLAIGGVSSGGFLALHALWQDPGGIDMLVLGNPVTKIGPDGYNNRATGLGTQGITSPMRFADQLPQIPALVVHPSRDKVVGIDVSVNFLRNWGNPDAHLAAWPKGDHGSFRADRNIARFAQILANFLTTPR